MTKSRFREIGGKLGDGNDFWFELSGGLKHQGFEKSDSTVFQSNTKVANTNEPLVGVIYISY